MQRSTEQLTRCSTGTLEEVLENTEGVVATQTVSEKIMGVCKNTIRWVLVVDLLLCLTVIIVLGILEFGTVLPQHRFGFYCNDPKISFKFSGDTISMAFLLCATIVGPFIVMWIAEYMCHPADSYDVVPGCAGSRIKQIWHWYGHYAVGVVSLTILTEVMKVVVGEPRPHFLDTCRPREAENCTDEYITTYTCTNKIYSQWFITDSSRSFPSGHSALSVFTTVFLVWYLHNRLPNRTLFLKPWLQCLVCMWAAVCALTRICDNRHHWWDVLAGAILGVAFSLLTVVTLCRNFKVGLNLHNSNDSVENDQASDKRHHSVKKLLADPAIDVPEDRELKSITTWKE